MPTIILETIINAPIELVFDLTRDIDLHVATMGKTKERAIAGRMSGPVEKGDTITFEAVHFGVKQKLSSRIAAFERPTYFADEMTSGVFKTLYHEHYFTALAADRTLMRDKMRFESPFGIFGHIFNRLVLTQYMRCFLLQRNEKLKALIESGKWKELVKTPASY
jgi:ligand-binding SRPBCC domain-containing protein